MGPRASQDLRSLSLIMAPVFTQNKGWGGGGWGSPQLDPLLECQQSYHNDTPLKTKQLTCDVILEKYNWWLYSTVAN